MISAIFFLFTAYLPVSVGILLTTCLAFNYIDSNQYVTTSYIFSAPLVISIIIPPLFAVAIKHLSNSIKTMMSFIARILFFIILIFILLSLNSPDRINLLYYAIALIFLSIDQVISSNAPLIAKYKFKFAFSQSTSFANILGRGFQSIAPFFAIQLLHSPNIYAWNMLIILLILLSLLYPYYVFQFYKQEQPQSISNTNKPLMAKSGFDAWAWWYIAFSLLINISQGAVSFILLSFNENNQGKILMTIVYGAFLLIQIGVIFGLLKKFKSPTSLTVIILLLANSLFLMILSYGTSPIGQYVFVLFIGSLYGLSLSLLSEVIFSRVNESCFREMLAYGRSVGRLASLAALWLAGFGLSWGLDSRSLLFISGFMLFVSALILGFAALLIMRRSRNPV